MIHGSGANVAELDHARPPIPRSRRPAAVPPQQGERLQKALAEAGIASRRDAEFAIRAGRVRVTGRRVRSPRLVDPSRDLIELDGEVVELQAGPARRRASGSTSTLNKRKGVIFDRARPGRSRNVVELVRGAARRPPR